MKNLNLFEIDKDKSKKICERIKHFNRQEYSQKLLDSNNSKKIKLYLDRSLKKKKENINKTTNKDPLIFFLLNKNHQKQVKLNKNNVNNCGYNCCNNINDDEINKIILSKVSGENISDKKEEFEDSQITTSNTYCLNKHNENRITYIKEEIDENYLENAKQRLFKKFKNEINNYNQYGFIDDNLSKSELNNIIYKTKQHKFEKKGNIHLSQNEVLIKDYENRKKLIEKEYKINKYFNVEYLSNMNKIIEDFLNSQKLRMCESNNISRINGKNSNENLSYDSKGYNNTNAINNSKDKRINNNENNDNNTIINNINSNENSKNYNCKTDFSINEISNNNNSSIDNSGININWNEASIKLMKMDSKEILISKSKTFKKKTLQISKGKSTSLFKEKLNRRTMTFKNNFGNICNNLNIQKDHGLTENQNYSELNEGLNKKSISLNKSSISISFKKKGSIIKGEGLGNEELNSNISICSIKTDEIPSEIDSDISLNSS